MSRSRFARSALVTLVVALGAGSCSRDGNTPTSGLTGPSPTGSAGAYVDEIVDIMRVNSINTHTIDWGQFRSEVLAAVGAGQTIRDTYPAIEVALRLLNDQQSYYNTRERALIGPPPVGGCRTATPATQSLPATIAYVKVASCDCQGAAATTFAESIQQAIKAADRPGLVGWIVDLRGNFGGNMWPMIAGVGPVLGEGIVGHIVYNNREYEREYRDGAALSLGEPFARVAVPYRLLHEYPRVAVLTDGVVASSGEAVTVFFRGRPGTRSFGTPTCGHHHLNVPFSLSDGATLFLVVSQHADRTKVQYAGAIPPDEIIADPEAAFSRAISWLLTGG